MLTMISHCSELILLSIWTTRSAIPNFIDNVSLFNSIEVSEIYNSPLQLNQEFKMSFYHCRSNFNLRRLKYLFPQNSLTRTHCTHILVYLEPGGGKPKSWHWENWNRQVDGFCFNHESEAYWESSKNSLSWQSYDQIIFGQYLSRDLCPEECMSILTK